jgi:hypothetical protein
LPAPEPLDDRAPGRVGEGLKDEVELRRIEEVAYESPALPLSYSAAEGKLIERDPERQPRSIERITIGQHIAPGAVREGPGYDGLTATPTKPRDERIMPMPLRRMPRGDIRSLASTYRH